MNFWNGFLKGPFENSVMFLKIKEINFKKNIWIKIPSKTKENKITKYNFWQPRKLKVRMEANLHEFPKTLEKEIKLSEGSLK